MISDETLGRVLPRGGVALVGDLVRWSLWTAAVLGAGTVAAVYLRLGLLLLERPGDNDFTIFYYTARMVAEGRAMYGDLPREYGLAWKASHLGNLNPPHFQLLMAPFARVDYRPALAAWLAVNAGLAGLSLAMIVRELRIRLTLRRLLLGAIAVFGCTAYTGVVATGEMSLWLLPPFTRAWICARRGRWTEAGAWLGLVASLKLFVLVPIAWLAATRRWRATAAALCAAGVAVAVGAAAYGAGAYADWVSGLGRIGWWWLPMNASLRGLVSRLFDAGAGMAPVIPAPWLVQPVWMLLAALVVLVTVWRTLRLATPILAPETVDATFLVLVLAALLVSPLGWVYYLPLVTGPALAVAMGGSLLDRPGWQRGLLLGSVALFYVPFEVAEAWQPSRFATLTLASVYGWGLLGWWTALVLRVLYPPSAG